MWELLFKISLTLVLVIPVAGALRWIWTNQLDPGATVSRIFQSASEPEWVATRDPMKLYQEGQSVADITGAISEEGLRVVFMQLVNAASLDVSQPVEWRRLNLRVVRVRESIDLAGGGGGVLQDVRRGVECQIIQ
jgi:hypothetical protein